MNIVMDNSKIEEYSSEQEKYSKLLSENSDEIHMYTRLFESYREMEKPNEELEDILKTIDSLERKRKELSSLYLKAIRENK